MWLEGYKYARLMAQFDDGELFISSDKAIFSIWLMGGGLSVWDECGLWWCIMCYGEGHINSMN